MRPKAGEIYVVNEPFESGVVIHWRAPMTTGYDQTLPAGLRFEIIHDPPPGAGGAYARPLDATWEGSFVRPEDRAHPKYDGYSLVVGLDDIENRCGKAR